MVSDVHKCYRGRRITVAEAVAAVLLVAAADAYEPAIECLFGTKLKFVVHLQAELERTTVFT